MFQDLIEALDREEVLAQVLAEIANPVHNFPLTDVHPGSVWRTLVEGDVAALTDLYKLIPRLAEAGFLERAEGEWLDMRARNFYDIERRQSVFARYRVRLTAQSGFGPYNIDAGQFWVLANPSLRYYNTEGGTLEPASSLDLEFIAEEAGSRYNVVEGSIVKMLTPLPGVSVINLENSLLVAGSNAETDSQLRRRTKLRWPELGTGGPADSYVKWALDASPNITRVLVRDNHPRGQGTVDVVVAGVGGTGVQDVALADEYIQARRPVTADVEVMAAEVFSLTVQGTVYCNPGATEIAELAILENFQQLELDMGIGAIIYRAEVIEQVMRAPGVVNVALNQPTTDVDLGYDEIVNFVPDFELVEV